MTGYNDNMKTESVLIQDELAKSKSKITHYSDLIIGQRGLGYLIRYELILLLCAMIPGALGLFLRSKLYPLLLGSCGRNVVFGVNVTLRHPHKIHIGDDVIIDDNCMLDAKGVNNAGIRIGNNVFLGRNSILSCKNGDIVLEDRVNIGFNAEVFSGHRVVIGADTLIAAYCYFIGGDHASTDAETAINQQGTTALGITVGPRCWFGAGVKVLDGVEVGTDSVIGAGAVVTRAIPDFAIATGVPARVRRDRRTEV